MANHSLELIVPLVSGDRRRIRDHANPRPCESETMRIRDHANHDTYLEIEIHLYR